MSTQTLEERWDHLQPDSQKPVFQLVDALHPLPFYVGRATNGDRLLLLVTEERPAITRTFRAVRIDVYAREDGKWSLLIALQNTELVHVFALLCEDLIEAGRKVRGPERPLAFVLQRLALWQRLLERGGAELLADSAIRGLVAELAFLRLQLIPELGALPAVECWVGPFGADQDFQAPTSAWEVKSTRADADSVQIASEGQLYSPSRSLRLVVVCLEECAQVDESGAFSLNSLVDALRTVLSVDVGAVDIFDSRLVEVGFVRRPEYDRPLFRLPWMKQFNVLKEFPRIVKPELPVGTRGVRYELDLSFCAPFLVSTSSELRVLNET